MSGSGLVYAAVLAAWGAYFVSRSMRSGVREVAFAPEGTVLRRRGATDPAGGYSVLRMQAERPAAPEVKPRQVPGPVAPAPAPYRVSRATARRRRRALGVLAGLLLVAMALTLVGVLPGWTAGVPALLLITYLVELRVQTRRAMAPAVPAVVAAEVPARRRHQRQKSGAEFWDPWPSFDPAETPKGAVADLAKGWEPRPVPLPTYVTAPRAESVPGTRSIDIAAGRAWTGATETADADAETRPMPFKPGDVVAEAPASAEEPAVQEEFELRPAVGD